MAELTCGELKIALEPGESVLRALERSGVIVPSSCRAGACQSCLVRVTRGEVPARARLGLKESLCVRGFALACQTVPTGDLEVEVGAARALELPARVTHVERLGPDILRVLLTVSGELGYRAGQFITLVRPDGLARPYSIASRPAGGSELELHVRLLPGGRMSGWLSSEEARGAAVAVRGPAGDCFYLEGQPDQPLVLAGVGSGLAPLWGIVRDALASGHRGPIELWHGARTAEGLYLREELRGLQAQHENFVYRPCALESAEDGVLAGRLDQLLLGAAASFAAPRFYLCGDAPFVQGLKRALFLRGASLRNIFADAFVGVPSPNSG